MSEPQPTTDDAPQRLPQNGPIGRLIGFCLRNKLVVALTLVGLVAWGIIVAPFDWNLERWIVRDPVPTDAIPDIGENQQVVFTEWMGRSPKDVQDQVTYPLTVALLGLPEVKTVRSYSYFGFSTIYVIFREKVDFYWSRSRVLEKLNSLPPGTLPEGVRPTLGPDATALGQVFWYTLEGRDPDGRPIGGWDPQELRSIQDWDVRYSLASVEGIAEVASVGGFVQEYQVDVDPDAMRAYGVTIDEVTQSVKRSNLDVGARTLEANRVEYVIRGLGFIKQVSDIENTVITSHDNTPIFVRNVAHVALGPAPRRGALDKGGAEAVGGVATVRYGYNPLAAIKQLKVRIDEIAPGLPRKPVVDYHLATREQVADFAREQGFQGYAEADRLNAEAWLAWLDTQPRGRWPSWINTSRVTVQPFYDRTELIYETLGTLNKALAEEILVTIIVVLIMVMHLRSSLLISAQLPLAVLMCFIAMRLFGVDANIVALSGIAIAIGTIVDMGIIVNENILRHLAAADPSESRLAVVHRASAEVGSAVLTAVATTIVGFLPVFTMTDAAGKLFRPLAFTKTFALLASIVVALTIIPPAAHLLIARPRPRRFLVRVVLHGLVIAVGLVVGFWLAWWAGLIVAALGAWGLVAEFLPERLKKVGPWVVNGAAVLVVAVLLARHWLPLGPQKGLPLNLIFVAGMIGGLLLAFYLLRLVYVPLLRWFLDHKLLFLSVPAAVVVVGLVIWLGFGRTIGRAVPQTFRETVVYGALADEFPGLGREFMPPLDEGSFLYMPTTMPHASIGEALDIIRKQDRALQAIPEIDTVVGKLGRADTALDPAPVSMIETVISYKSEYKTDAAGNRLRFRWDRAAGQFARGGDGELVVDDNGRPYRQWRPHIHSPDDIWDEIVRATQIPGTTGAPKLQPIAARIVMLQSGMRAPMGVKIKGGDLETIEQVALQVERLLKEVPSVDPETVIADRIVGKPYLEIDIDRQAIARHGLKIEQVQEVIETAIGGRQVTTTVEGRRRYPVRVRYLRELRDRIDTLDRILVPAPDGTQIPLAQLATIDYVRGPQVIKSEDTFLVGYVVFDKRSGYAEVDVVEQCRDYLESQRASGRFRVPPGVSYPFAGSYENQVRAQRTLMVVIPVALFVIFIILYFQFKSVPTSLLVFSGIAVAWSGGFLLIWLYGQPWFLDLTVFGVNMRDLFQIHPINLSTAIWVGFLALFGIASDDGVVIATYLDQSFAGRTVRSIRDAREATVAAAARRIRPCLMTSATTILALLPVLASQGRGSDIMVPMAIPSLGGMIVVIVTIFTTPVLYCAVKELKLRAGLHDRLLDA